MGEQRGPMRTAPDLAVAAATGPIQIDACDLGVDGSHGPLLTPTTLTASSGEVTLVAGDPGHGHTALALALGGRLVPSTGSVAVRGTAAAPRPFARTPVPRGPGGRLRRRLDRGSVGRSLRSAVALVDVPGVSEPDGVLPLSAVVGEELAMAGGAAHRSGPASWLAERGLDGYRRTRVEALPPAVRTLVLTELAAARPGTAALVLTAPDRHGANPWTWRTLAARLADHGFAVVVTCTEASAALLGEDPVPLGGPQVRAHCLQMVAS